METMNYMAVPGLKLDKSMTKEKTVECIIDTVCIYCGVSKKLVLGTKSRRKELVRARHLCRWYLLKNTKMTLKEVGEIWGADHTTIIHSRNHVKEQIEAKHDNEFKIHIELLNKQL